MAKEGDLTLRERAEIHKKNLHLYTEEENLQIMLDWEKDYKKQRLLKNVKIHKH